MKPFLSTLKSRNAVLYGFGFICLISGAVCVSLTLTTTGQVLGINAFIKPAKFFLSVWIFCWTMAWLLPLLNRPRATTTYAWMVVAVMTFELGVIAIQATRGKLSHFNTSSVLDAVLFSTMGLAITVLTAWTAYIGVLFFRLKTSVISPAYLWGIRLGISLFVLFAFEGFLMAARLGHTVGAVDGGPGLPIINWSTQYGDLRIAHFFGMHALQLLPLFGYYLARRPRQVILLATVYLFFVTFLLVQSLSGKALLAGLMH